MNRKTLILFFAIITVFVSTWTYISAEGEQISICVKKSGLVYVIGDEFKRKDCRKNDSLLSWDIASAQGEKGDKGEQGEQGPIGPQGLQGELGQDATHGAGNIAFCDDRTDCLRVLKTDGTVWVWNQSDSTWYIDSNQPTSVPVSTDNILSWSKVLFLDINGDVWRWEACNSTWINIGHP